MRSLYFLLSLFVAVFSSMAVVQADDDETMVPVYNRNEIWAAPY